MEPFILKKVEGILGKNFCKELLEGGETTATVKREDGLGLDIKNGWIVGISYSSQFTGQLKVGDCLVAINGALVIDYAKVIKPITALIQQQPTTRLVIKYVRLRRRITRPSMFPAIPKQEGYTYETVILYNLKGVFHLGLDVKDIDGKVVVVSMLENTIADMTFSLGEAILDVDGEKVITPAMFSDRVKKSMEIRNYALCYIEIPDTDPIKNMIRNKIAASIKDQVRINPIPPDAKIHCAEGIAVLKRNIEPKSVWAGEKSALSAPSTKQSPMQLRIEEKVKEQDVPSGWNSRLFVKLPPAKSVESEGVQNRD